MKMCGFKGYLYGLVGLFLIANTSVAAEEQKKQPSDKSVKVLMKFAFNLMPSVYTKPNGKKITIDAKKPAEVMIPIDDARRIVRIAYRSAQAQKCDLRDEQTQNHNAMVAYERIFHNWTDKQLLFINQLHLFTVLWLTGNAKVEVVDKDTKPKDPEQAVKKLKPQQFDCPGDKKKQVAASVEAYLQKTSDQIREELKRRKELGKGSNKTGNNDKVADKKK